MNLWNRAPQGDPNDKKAFMNNTVFVSGSSRGIGKAIALRLAREGYDLVLHCRTGIEQAETVRAETQALGRGARILQFDIADRETAETLLLEDVEAHGAYYGVVCNAGITADN